MVVTGKPQNSYYSLNIFKQNSFQDTTDLLSSDNLKVAITQLCNDLQFYCVLGGKQI